MGEALALNSGADVLILRVASLFGIAGSSGKGGNFVETMIKQAREKGELRVVDDIRMCPTATSDVAAATLKLLRADAASGIYHVVNSGDASWFEFASAIVEDADVPAKMIPIPRREYTTFAARPDYSVLDNEKVSQIVGPLRHWREALREYLAAKRHLETAPTA
jgi:dTDP-4-dehydrorhamnose reductase